ncbi:MAG: TonB-dependent receptor plug domain-containing protein [Inhella sp.]
MPIDPLVVERIEVLRGPAALLYGGSAVGGVMNTIDNRIPRAPLAGPAGAAEARFGGATQERGLSALFETGGAGLALHADAFGRRTTDLRVPAFELPGAEGTSESPERRTRVRNSDSAAHGGRWAAHCSGATAIWAPAWTATATSTASWPKRTCASACSATSWPWPVKCANWPAPSAPCAPSSA